MRAWNLPQLPRAAGRRRQRRYTDRGEERERGREEREKERVKITGWPLALCTWWWGQQSLLPCPSCHLLLTSKCCIVLVHSLCLFKLHPSASPLILSVSICFDIFLPEADIFVCFCFSRLIPFATMGNYKWGLVKQNNNKNKKKTQADLLVNDYRLLINNKFICSAAE